MIPGGDHSTKEERLQPKKQGTYCRVSQEILSNS